METPAVADMGYPGRAPPERGGWNWTLLGKEGVANGFNLFPPGRRSFQKTIESVCGRLTLATQEVPPGSGRPQGVQRRFQWVV